MNHWQIAGIIVSIVISISTLTIALWKINERSKEYFDKKINKGIEDFSKGKILCMIEFEKFKDVVWKRYDDMKTILKNEYLRTELFKVHDEYIKQNFGRIENTMELMNIKLDKMLMKMEIK